MWFSEWARGGADRSDESFEVAHAHNIATAAITLKPDRRILKAAFRAPQVVHLALVGCKPIHPLWFPLLDELRIRRAKVTKKSNGLPAICKG
jgi:hypothetical protein